jgi:hypothetical protein
MPLVLRTSLDNAAALPTYPQPPQQQQEFVDEWLRKGRVSTVSEHDHDPLEYVITIAWIP